MSYKSSDIMEKPNRLLCPDICKFIAIFLVTCSHSAQRIQGDMMSNFLGGTQLDIAFNMPLFMIMSGWFINPTKLKNSFFPGFVKDKFFRLMVPALTWYFIYDLLSFHTPSMHDALTLYWYLTALFVCLCLINISVRLINNTLLCAILSSVFVICCPHSDFAKINFMFPFLWAGYFLRTMLDKHGKQWWLFLICLLISIMLAIFWQPKYSVYTTPFKILSVNLPMLVAYVYRFSIGLLISIVIIFIIKNLEKLKLLSYLAKLGQYSLVIYTASVVLNSALLSFLNRYDIHTSQFVLIDLLAIGVASVIVLVSVIFANWCRKNKYTSILFLGEQGNNR